MNKWITPIFTALLLASTNAPAATKVPVVLGESVLTLRVDGDLTIGPDGKVQAYQVRTTLEPQIDALVSKAVNRWRFRPVTVDGVPVVAKSPMRITLAATEAKGGYAVRVDNVTFRPNTRENYEAALASEQKIRAQGKTLDVTGEAQSHGQHVLIRSQKPPPPSYPEGLMAAGVEGAVLLNLRLNPDGSVAEVFASQSSLLNVKGGSARVLDRARTMLEKSAANAAGKWRFDVQAEDVAALKPSALTVRVPVQYVLGPVPRDGSDPLTGKWRHEYRGPNFPVPWLIGADEQVVGVSDVDSNEMITGSSPFKLLDQSVIGNAL